MSSENFEYKFYQNFVITWDQFYDSANRKLTMEEFYYVMEDNSVVANETNTGKKGDLGLTPFESAIIKIGDELEIGIITQNGELPPRTNGNLNIFFDISLNPPRANPKKIVVKNFSSSITTSQGNSFQILCPQLFKYPIQFLDSINNNIIYEEYRDQPLPALQVQINLQRLSGTNPLQTLVDGVGTFPYVANPSLNFTIVYEYW